VAATGGGILVGKGQIALEAAVVTPGLAVLAIIIFMGAVSGAHLNPGSRSPSLSPRRLRWKRVPGYQPPLSLNRYEALAVGCPASSE
jgi:aquaporin Z